MKTAVSNNTDRSNVKIVEQYNKIISDYGYEEEKVKMENVTELNKVKNRVAFQKHTLKYPGSL